MPLLVIVWRVLHISLLSICGLDVSRQRPAMRTDFHSLWSAGAVALSKPYEPLLSGELLLLKR